MKIIAHQGKKSQNGFICPICNETVEDNSDYRIAPKTRQGKTALVCPTCNNVVNGLPLLHHGGTTSDEFYPYHSSTDYFKFRHRPCEDEEYRGVCEVYAFLIDKHGRLIFNFRCLDCGTIEAMKTHTDLETDEKARVTTEHVYLSPELSSRVEKQWWDR